MCLSDDEEFKALETWMAPIFTPRCAALYSGYFYMPPQSSRYITWRKFLVVFCIFFLCALTAPEFMLFLKMDMDLGVSVNTRVPFLGFMAGSILFGVTILQAYQYFLNYASDSKSRKITVLVVCFLDCLHFTFSAIMMCVAYTSDKRFTDPNVTWSLKALSMTDALLLVFVQSFYLRLIWMLSDSLSIPTKVTRAIRAFSALTFVYALGIASALVAYMVQVRQVFQFTVSFKHIVCIAIGSTAAIDSAIAMTMTVVLYKMMPPTEIPDRPARRGMHTVNQLVLFFVGSGILTAVCAMIRLALFVADPSSTMYLALHFSIPRLYVNSILGLFNSKTRLKEKMGSTGDFHLSSMILFGDSVESENLSEK